jgi:hypothetical protein
VTTDTRNLLAEKKSAILEKWFDKVIEAYPAETSGFLRGKKKQFTNPVGYTVAQGLETLLDELLREEKMDFDKISPVLDSIIRIRAVQDLTPSQALVFVSHLKKVIREELGNRDVMSSEEREALESRIDALVLVSFDIYVKCREKIYDLKTNELKNMTFRLLQKANLVCEIPDSDQ